MKNSEIVKRAFQLIESGQFEEAIVILKKEIEDHPNSASLYYHIGFAYRMIQDFNRAIESYNKAISLDPNYYMHYYGLAIVLQQDGQFDEAISQFRKAHKLNPNSAEVLNGAALTHKLKGDLDKATELYDHALQAVVRQKMNELKEEGTSSIHVTEEDQLSIASLNQKMLEMMPMKLKEDLLYASINNNLGICYAEMGKKEEAIASFKESVAFTPEGMTYDPPIHALNELTKKI